STPATAAATSANRSLPSRWWRESIARSLTPGERETFTMADLLVCGTLHTLDRARPRAQAALIRDGRFLRVGTREECEREAAPDVKFIELGEGCAVPGLIDAHGHPLLHGRMLGEVRLGGAHSAEECAQ